ncbi:Signal transduction histidine kinase [Pseudoxanthomonas sp. GM95]|uniref:sensor histidine kinase n=1 Tax=Pseudoxanthomonas sp. GM95 TaxID=1881043 RepID=UPI0008D58ECE|nr:HAMP domain-containing sensor histidine kinase [Pseudoxanthomonas sp. GM95]SEL57886.1 Signal transduction histidine kinase [Pseudoxanthomonas sp. GM95]
MRPRSLTARLMLAAVAGLAAATVVACVLVWIGADLRSPDRLLHAELEEEVADIQAGLRIGPAGSVHVWLKQGNARVYDAMPRDAAYQLFDAAGRSVAHSPQGPALQALMGMSPGPDEQAVPISNGGGQLRLIQRSIRHADQVFTVRVARSDRLVLTLRDYADKLYVRAGLATALLALMTFGAVVFLTVRRMILPLHRVSQVAAGIGPRNLTTRLDVARVPLEIVPLVQGFNTALERLERGYRVQQEFLAAAAHELKTPLALLQAEIELGGAANTELLLRDTGLMARQVHQLLHLAEVSEGHNYTFAAIDPGSVLEEVKEYVARFAHQRSVHLEFAREPGALGHIEGDAAALFVLAKNLLENALNHAPAGSVVLVMLGADGFSVQDQGPGVAPSDRAHLFQRFWRSQRDGNGAGLGLAICQEICAAHGWRVGLADVQAGQGACFFVAMKPSEAAR